MSYLRRISERHQVTIPPSLLDAAGIPEGALVSIIAEPGRIILEPRQILQKDLSDEDWKALDSLVKDQLNQGKYEECPDPRSAKKHLRRLRK
ncbi:MAG: AbrB/MazE/SpoVT family DNA-binding domain-containing protein [Elusimicrobiota bacterium]|jgi:bifunctional DNA-binding transcriptional regulator/antitoxin component of YhaV-PrlF toxin-antitoxin module